MSSSNSRPPLLRCKPTQTGIRPPGPRPPCWSTQPMSLSMIRAEWEKKRSQKSLTSDQPIAPPISIPQEALPRSGEKSLIQLADKGDISSSSTSTITLPGCDHKDSIKTCGKLDDLFECGGCELKRKSTRYHCTKCNKQFHTECLTFKKTEKGHKHDYKLRSYNKIFECNGCKEVGFGKRMRCDQCGHELHTVCKFAEDPGYVKWLPERPFKYQKKEEKGQQNRICHLCSNEIEGYFYQRDELYLHPCCIFMEPVLFAGTKKELESRDIKDEQRYTLVSTIENGPECVICDHKKPYVGPKQERPDKGWSYVCDDRTHCYHVYCLRKMVHEAWATVNIGDEDIPKEIEIFAEDKLKVYGSTRKDSSALKYAKKFFTMIVKMIVSTLMGDPTFGFIHLAGVIMNG